MQQLERDRNFPYVFRIKLKKEEELLVSEARYRSLYDNSGDGISIISIEGKIISANKQVYARLGYTADAIKTKNPEGNSSPNHPLND